MHTRTRLVVFLVLHSPYEGLLQPVHDSRALLKAVSRVFSPFAITFSFYIFRSLSMQSGLGPLAL